MITLAAALGDRPEAVVSPLLTLYISCLAFSLVGGGLVLLSPRPWSRAHYVVWTGVLVGAVGIILRAVPYLPGTLP